MPPVRGVNLVQSRCRSAKKRCATRKRRLVENVNASG